VAHLPWLAHDRGHAEGAAPGGKVIADRRRETDGRTKRGDQACYRGMTSA
jgi:hypothetical protein